MLILVFAFRSSAALAYAFGMAVTGTITITTLLFLYIARTAAGAPLWLVLIGGGALLAVDLMFVAANLTKLVHGAWLPLLIAHLRVHRDDHLAARAPDRHRAPGNRPRARCGSSSTGSAPAQPPLVRLPGTAVFLNRGR